MICAIALQVLHIVTKLAQAGGFGVPWSLGH